MKRILLIATLLFAARAASTAQTITLTSSQLADSAGHLITAQLNITPTLSSGLPTAYQKGGGGTVSAVPVPVYVQSGALSIVLPATDATSPRHICFKVTSSNPKIVLPAGFSCLQPHAVTNMILVGGNWVTDSGDWCQAGVCNLDNYVPTLTALATAIVGPQGPAGAAGATGATGSTGPAGPAINGLTSNGSNGINVAGTVAAGTSVSAPTVTVTGTPTNATDAATVAYVGTHGGGSGTVSQWTRLGSLFTPSVADENSGQEPNVIYEANPVLLTPPAPVPAGNPQLSVFKLIWTCSWLAGNICYAESYSGLPGTWVRAANPIIAGNHARPFVLKNGSTYYLYAQHINSGGGGLGFDQYTSSSMAGPYTLAHSNVIVQSQSWEVTAGGGNIDVWVEGSTWYTQYEWQTNTFSGNPFAEGLATSSDGVTWTKYPGNPTLGGTSAYPTVGGPDIHKVGSTYYNWSTTSVPSPQTYGGGNITPDGIMRFSSTDLHAWVPSANFSLFCATDDEGAGLGVCQMADPNLVEVNGMTYMFHEGTVNGNSQNGNIHLKLAIMPLTIAQLVSLSEQQGPVLGPSGVTIPTYVLPPSHPGASGAAGQYSTNLGYRFDYDNSTALWGRSAITETGWGYQALDNFTDTAGTALSSHTDALGNTYALYTNSGTGGSQTIGTINPTSGFATLTTGAGATFSDVLSSLTPSSADYTVSLTCTLTSSTANYGQVAIWARANSAANTNYLISSAPNNAANLQLAKDVTSTYTILNTHAFTWSNGATHTIALGVSGTAISMYIDGSLATSQTDSAVTATGQAGFRVTQGIQCSNFTVQ